MIAERPASVLLGGSERPRRPGFWGACGVQVFAVIFPLLLSAAVTVAGDENDFRLVSSPCTAQPDSASGPRLAVPARLLSPSPRDCPPRPPSTHSPSVFRPLASAFSLLPLLRPLFSEAPLSSQPLPRSEPPLPSNLSLAFPALF